ncbi:hypothetical protein B0O80DRAFT_272971 [Mortierella sp. GBAus27b]|nr:hypothetical protein B0O80DRAFT_272971 [Mortierella sp. GBAus27b]
MDTAMLRYEAGARGTMTTETPVHHTHDFIPTPMVLGISDVIPPSATRDNEPTHHFDLLPIDLTLPGHLPDSTNLAIGKIRYELQVSLELTFAHGTSDSVTEQFILRRPVVVHRIVYPSAHLQPRVAMGLDSGGVEIQIKVPKLLHCENTLLAVELYAKPRTRNVKLRKAKVVFEQIETDRYQRTSSLAAVVPLATPTNAAAPSLSSQHTDLPNPQSTGPPPTPRLMTRAIAQPLEVDFEEPTSELETQNLSLQLVLSPDLNVDVQSSWLQICHTLRVEVEYTMDDEPYVTAPPISAPPPMDQPPIVPNVPEEEPLAPSSPITTDQEPPRHESAPEDKASEEQAPEPTIWDQEGDAIEAEAEAETGTEIAVNEDNHTTELDDERPTYSLDEKKAFSEGDNIGSSIVSDHHELGLSPEEAEALADFLPPLPTTKVTTASNRAVFSSGSTTSSLSCSVATEEISVRVVRVVSTGLVDASTLAQAAGEVEAGLPTYESVIEATGLPAYAEEKLEDDREEAEASGTATGVLGGAARRLEGEDAEIERRSE